MASPKNADSSVLSVKDFGPIAEATVELRPFTVFVGASNTGKSYLAILLYALHQFFGPSGLGRQPAPPMLFRYEPRVGRDDSIGRERADSALAWLQGLDLRRGRDDVDVTLPDEVAALVRPVLGDVGELAPSLHDEVTRCFGVADARSLIRHSARNSAQVALRRSVVCEGQDNEEVGYGLTITRSQPQLCASIPADMPLRIHGDYRLHMRLLASRAQATSPRRQYRLMRLLGGLADLALPHVIGTVSRPIHYLPADRAGVMHAHRVVVSSLIGRASRAGLDVESPLPALSGVLADFLDRLIELGDAEPRKKSAATQLAESLEANILGGAVDVRGSAVGYPSFHYRPANWKKDDLALMNTSAMVSELAPVVLYLRHVVRPGDVLIIEEPESHLHPAMQVAFTHFLATVVLRGIRVVVTTHSEWVLETLANLVRLSEVDKSRRKLVGDGPALTPDQVGAWLFEQRKRPKGSVVKEIPLDVASGTFPAGFGEITEDLYNHWAAIANLVMERSA